MVERLDRARIENYELLEKQSFHQNREVFKARLRSGEQAGEPVILKRLRLGQLQDLKALELFEREAQTLQTLEHERIPGLLEFFHQQLEGQLVLTMVMQYIPGPTLAQRLQSGWRPQEAEVLEIARQGFEILNYLQQHEPLVIHRDIKPSNLIWTDQQELYLIDFGAVRDLFVRKGSSTVIGTFGYMAPEQFAGQSVPATDLYGLGASLLHLLSGRPPSEIPQKHLMPDFRPYVRCSVELQRFLEQLLVPDLEERLPNAQVALDHLETLTRFREVSPSGRLVYRREGQQATIELKPSLHPRALFRQHKMVLLALGGFLGINLLSCLWMLPLLFRYAGTDEGLRNFVGGYLLVGFFVLGLGIRQLLRMGGEQLVISLHPDLIVIEKKKPKAETLSIPALALTDVSRELLQIHTKFSRDGVSLRLDPDLAPDLRHHQLELAMGLGKADQHWLMTKLLQYHYQLQRLQPGGTSQDE